MPRVGAMTTTELMNRLRKRQGEILQSLSPELLAEYTKLAEMIALIRAEEDRVAAAHGKKIGDAVGVPVFIEDHGGLELVIKGAPPATSVGTRLPLAVQKEKVIRFLDNNGPMPRSTILSMTGVPAGSLSALLKGKEFKQNDTGNWELNYDEIEKPGPSDPPAKK